jgi:hypothetical protein
VFSLWHLKTQLLTRKLGMYIGKVAECWILVNLFNMMQVYFYIFLNLWKKFERLHRHVITWCPWKLFTFTYKTMDIWSTGLNSDCYVPVLPVCFFFSVYSFYYYFFFYISYRNIWKQQIFDFKCP